MKQAPSAYPSIIRMGAAYHDIILTEPDGYKVRVSLTGHTKRDMKNVSQWLCARHNITPR